MRPLVLLLIATTALHAAADKLWSDLKAKRDNLSGYHQEFTVEQTFKTQEHSQSAKRQIVIDVSQGRWREKSVTGSGNFIKVFDGAELFSLEEGGDEYVRVKYRSKKEGDPSPVPYGAGEPDWAKSFEVERRPCGLPKLNHPCVLLEAPLKPWTHVNSPSNITHMRQGSERILLDMETGLLLSSRAIQLIEGPRSSYQSDVAYTLERMTYGVAGEASLFRPPDGDMKEVKELSAWNAARIKKKLVGNPAPELAMTDIEGKPVKLAALKGKTVLLDFWTTWCPPCRADAPALDKLYSKYGGKDLAIVGISVSEDRVIVEKFLKEHPHSFSIVLTTENEMPRPYQIGVFPTYIVINGDGTVASASEGEKGFSDLRKLLKKAGLDTD